jgi:hypothetical protein
MAKKKAKLKPEQFPKYLQRLLFDRKPDEHRIMIFKEHHGERYFAADTPEQICGACLKWLTDMFGEHKPFYYKASEMVKEARERLQRLEAGTRPDFDPKKPSMPKDEIDKLPEDLQEVVREQWKKFDRQRAEYGREIAEWETTQKTIAEKDLAKAFLLKWETRGREDEDVRFEYLEMAGG